MAAEITVTLSTLDTLMIETVIRNRIDEINQLETRGFNPDGNNEIRDSYRRILDKIAPQGMTYRS